MIRENQRVARQYKQQERDRIAKLVSAIAWTEVHLNTLQVFEKLPSCTEGTPRHSIPVSRRKLFRLR